DTFALVLRKVRDGEVREPAALVGFVRSTARHLLLADRRKAGRYDEIDDASIPLDRRGGPLAAEASALQHVLADEEARMARQLLGELRHDRDREVLMRFYLGDEPSQTICDDLGVDPSLFNRVLYRARQRMRELWERSAKQTRLLTSSGSVKKLAT
ncbi:MAG: sigma-70 family RNA polymerase sigma factor, partial [Acidobacteriota bacterium]